MRILLKNVTTQFDIEYFILDLCNKLQKEVLEKIKGQGKKRGEVEVRKSNLNMLKSRQRIFKTRRREARKHLCVLMIKMRRYLKTRQKK